MSLRLCFLVLLSLLAAACAPAREAVPLVVAGSTVLPAASATAPAGPTDTPTPADATPQVVPTGVPTAVTATPAAAITAPAPGATATGLAAQPFAHIFVIVFENRSIESTLANPYFKQLAARGAFLSNYHGVGHPSQPNYLAMLAGATLVGDDGDHTLPQTNLVDRLEAAGLSWKAYEETYPGSCFAGSWSGDPIGGLYARKHNPFISFDNIRTNPRRCAQIVNASALAADIAANRLPAFSFYTPNQNNDGHDRPLDVAARWLQGFIEPKLADPNFATGTLVVIVFDESDVTTAGPADNHVYGLLLGPKVHAGSSDGARYTHYSILRTVEDNFGLATLNRGDATELPFGLCNFTAGCSP